MFNIGDTIFHTKHGLGRIVAIQKVEMLGSTTELASLELDNGMRVMLPLKDLGKSVRDPLAQAGATKVLEHLRACNGQVDGDHKVRSRKIQERLGSGDPFQLCEVIKGLLRRARQRTLANSDREQLQLATELLSRELAHAFGRDHQQVARELEVICQKGFATA